MNKTCKFCGNPGDLETTEGAFCRDCAARILSSLDADDENGFFAARCPKCKRLLYRFGRRNGKKMELEIKQGNAIYRLMAEVAYMRVTCPNCGKKSNFNV